MNFRLSSEHRHPAPKTARLLENRIIVPDEAEYNLLEYVGCGGVGVVFGDVRTCVKLQPAAEFSNYAMDLTCWASKTGLGPKLLSFGFLACTYREFAILQGLPGRKRKLPDWALEWNESKEPLMTLVFIAAERWDCDMEVYAQTYPDYVKMVSQVNRTLIDKIWNGLESLHAMNIIHSDVVPRNILLRKDKDGKILDVALTDFGNAMPRPWWFIMDDALFRNNILRYYKAQRWVVEVTSSLQFCLINTNVDAGIDDVTRYWLLNEPKNLDFAYLILWRMRCNPQETPTELKLPKPFNFNLKWNKSGLASVQVRSRLGVCSLVVNGVNSMQHVRRKLHNYDKKFRKLQFFEPEKACILPTDMERLFFPLDLLQFDAATGEHYFSMEKPEKIDTIQ